MTPEERKAIAMHQGGGSLHSYGRGRDRFYPACCSYHEGFDDALALVTDMVYEGGGFYVIKPPKVTP